MMVDLVHAARFSRCARARSSSMSGSRLSGLQQRDVRARGRPLDLRRPRKLAGKQHPCAARDRRRACQPRSPVIQVIAEIAGSTAGEQRDDESARSAHVHASDMAGTDRPAASVKREVTARVVALQPRAAGIARLIAQLLLDAEQLVVFRHRSERASEPVLICPQLVATARSAMVASSVSPERCDITAA